VSAQGGSFYIAEESDSGGVLKFMAGLRDGSR